MEWRPTLLNVNDILAVEHWDDKDSPFGEQSMIEVRKPHIRGDVDAPLPTTRMMCQQTINEIEQKIGQALGASRGWAHTRR